MTEQTQTEQPAEDLTDDWGEEPRKSAERLQGEDRLASLYPDEEQTPEQAEPEQKTEPKAEPQERREPESSDDDEAIFSKDDLELVTAVEPEYAQFQKDLAAFAQLKAIGPEKLADGDKAKAEAIRQQLSDAEAELRKRYETLQAAANQLAGKVQQRQLKKLERKLEAERQKLAERVPDLDKKALRTYLETRGFTKQEISMAADARLIEIAEKARRWDALQASKPRKTSVPKTARRPKPAPKPEPSRIDRRMAKIAALYPEKPKPRRKTTESDVLAILYG